VNGKKEIFTNSASSDIHLGFENVHCEFRKKCLARMNHSFCSSYTVKHLMNNSFIAYLA